MGGRIARWTTLAAVVAGLGAAWLFLAPPQLGGRTEYAITFGVSMEPHFHRGDLVVLRTHASYHVGEVVAYRSHDLHRTVLHRIIAIRDGLYTFKGDNNGFVDPEQPTAADLVGSEWLHVPRVGGWLAQLRSPRNAATAAGLVVLLLVAGGGAPAAQRRRRRRRHPLPTVVEHPAAKKRAAPLPPPTPAPPARAARAGAAAPSAGVVLGGAGAGVLAAAGILAAVAFSHPLQRSASWPGMYVQHGRFSYSAAVPGGATYQGRRVQSGQPVYLRLVRRLPVSFAYRVRTTQPGSLSGSASLVAVLHDDEGWQHTLVLAPRQRFAGESTVVRGTLDLGGLQRLITAFERQTGEHNSVYRVTLRAHVAVHGTVAAQAVSASFAPSVALDLDAYRLAVTEPADPTTAPNPLVATQSGTGSRTETATLRVLGRSITVAQARRLAEVVGAGGLALLLPGGGLLLGGRHGHEAAAIRRRYDEWIVDVSPIERKNVQERHVASMDALVRIAEQYERLILHEQRLDGDAFLVEEDGVVYTYRVRTWDGRLAVAR